MKKFIIVSAILFFLFFVIIFSGFYPVALVNGAPLYFRIWKKLEKSSMRFAKIQLEKIQKKPFDFSAKENVGLLLQGRKETLTLLIEDIIIEQQGKKLAADFEKFSKVRVEDALRKGKNMGNAATFFYGLSIDDFKELVLFPQARRDILREELENKGQNFESWLSEIKKKSRVRMLLVPFKWNGASVE